MSSDALIDIKCCAYSWDGDLVRNICKHYVARKKIIFDYRNEHAFFNKRNNSLPL
jgi:hypothetical protein